MLLHDHGLVVVIETESIPKAAALDSGNYGISAQSLLEGCASRVLPGGSCAAA